MAVQKKKFKRKIILYKNIIISVLKKFFAFISFYPCPFSPFSWIYFSRFLHYLLNAFFCLKISFSDNFIGGFPDQSIFLSFLLLNFFLK